MTGGGTVRRSYRPRSATPVAWPGHAGPGRAAREGEIGPPPATVVLRTGEALRPPPAPFRERPRIDTWPTSRARSSGTARTRSAGCATSRCGPRCAPAPRRAVTAAEAGAEDSAEALRLAVKRIDKAAAQGVIHKNTAANHKSRLVRRVAAIEAAPSSPRAPAELAPSSSVASLSADERSSRPCGR